MKRVALTGGIATGKSHVLARVSASGVPTIDADVLARAVLDPGTPGAAAVVQRFGPDMLLPDGQIDRRALGRGPGVEQPEAGGARAADAGSQRARPAQGVERALDLR